MGWLWGSSGPTSSDSTSQLDPSLKDFLENCTAGEKATTPDPSLHRQQQQQQQPPTYRDRVGLGRSEPENRPVSEVSQSAVPQESRFQDGRYAELWKNYKPFAEMENAYKSDQERLKDLYDRLEDQKHEVIRVANENCAIEEIKWKQCLTSGSMADRITMCRDDRTKYTRCFEMQQKVLKALGFMSAMHRTDMSYEAEMTERDRIQIHADKLYRRMVKREALRKDAEERGEKIPDFPPIKIAAMNIDEAIALDRSDEKIAAALGPLGGEPFTVSPTTKLPDESLESSNTPSIGSIWTSLKDTLSPAKPDFNNLDLSDLPDKMRVDLRALLQSQYQDGKITPEQLEIEKEAFKAKLVSEKTLVTGFIDYKDEERKQRAIRWEQGKPSIGDRMMRLSGRE